MAKYTVDIDDELIGFFRKNVDDGEKTEVMIVKLLRLLKVFLELGNGHYS